MRIYLAKISVIPLLCLTLFVTGALSVEGQVKNRQVLRKKEMPSLSTEQKLYILRLVQAVESVDANYYVYTNGIGTAFSVVTQVESLSKIAPVPLPSQLETRTTKMRNFYHGWGRLFTLIEIESERLTVLQRQERLNQILSEFGLRGQFPLTALGLLKNAAQLSRDNVKTACLSFKEFKDGWETALVERQVTTHISELTAFTNLLQEVIEKAKSSGISLTKNPQIKASVLQFLNGFESDMGKFERNLRLTKYKYDEQLLLLTGNAIRLASFGALNTTHEILLQILEKLKQIESRILPTKISKR